MEMFAFMIRDIVIIGILASFCDMLLPEGNVKHPVQLIFGLYFMALLLNPLITLWTDTDLSSLDLGSLAETQTVEAQEYYNEELVYAEAASVLEKEIEGKLDAIYESCDFSADIDMDKSGFQSVRVTVKGNVVSEAVMMADIRELLSGEYGIPADAMKIVTERS